MQLESLTYAQLLERAKNQAAELRLLQSGRAGTKLQATLESHKVNYAKLLQELEAAKADQTPVIVIGPKEDELHSLRFELNKLRMTRRPAWFVIYSWIWGEGK